MANENVVVDPPVPEPVVPQDLASVPEVPAPTESVAVPTPEPPIIADPPAPPPPAPESPPIPQPPPSFGQMFLSSATGITDAIDGLANSRNTKFNTRQARDTAEAAMFAADAKDSMADIGIVAAKAGFSDAIDDHVNLLREFQRTELA